MKRHFDSRFKAEYIIKYIHQYIIDHYNYNTITMVSFDYSVLSGLMLTFVSRENVLVFTWARPASRWGAPAGSSTAWSMPSSEVRLGELGDIFK